MAADSAPAARVAEWNRKHRVGLTDRATSDLLDLVAAARADERERITASVEALRLDEELTDLASFVWVETQHRPTQTHVVSLRNRLRAALAQTVDTEAAGGDRG